MTMVFQQPNPFPMSVFDNVAYVLREQAKRKPRRAVLRPQVEEALAHAGLLEEVRDNLDHPALRLSGGQQQRLCIARALAARPEVLLLDEPCSALDPQSTKVIEDLIVSLREELAIVIVTHNLQQAHRIADHVAFMYMGELVEYAPAETLFANPKQDRTREYVSGAFRVSAAQRGGACGRLRWCSVQPARWPALHVDAQHEAQRVQLDSARERAAVLSTKVTTANPRWCARRISRPSSSGGRTCVHRASVADGGRRAVTDLAISVGYSLGQTRVYLNDQAGLGYFQRPTCRPCSPSIRACGCTQLRERCHLVPSRSP